MRSTDDVVSDFHDCFQTILDHLRELVYGADQVEEAAQLMYRMDHAGELISQTMRKLARSLYANNRERIDTMVDMMAVLEEIAALPEVDEGRAA